MGKGQKGPTLGDIVRAARLEKGWSQEYLAEMVGDGITQSEVSQLERGHTHLPRRGRLERIAAALNIPSGRLLAAAGWSEADRHVEEAPGCLNFSVAPASRRGQILAAVAELSDTQLEIVASVVDGIKRSGYGTESSR